MSGSGVEELDSPFAVTLPPRPYPGLRPFEKDEWPIFFGRERMADAVVDQLIGKRVLVVHGDSGCGKSSLVRAAVLPRLEQESARGGIRWRTCATRPGESPLWNLADALAALASDQPNEERAIEIRRKLNFGRSAPAELDALLRESPDDHICILIDQFEELFAHAALHGPEEARLLTTFLTALYAEPPEGLYAVVTMRSEFLGACARFDGFAEIVNATQYLLPRMRHDDLLRAIREPAPLYNGEVTRELAERLIADAEGGQDQLPLIQHGLMLLHRDHTSAASDTSIPVALGPPGDRRPGSWRLGLEHYQHDGGLKGLLSDHADAVMQGAQPGHGGSNGASRIIEDLFRALTDINAEGQAIRRPRTLSQLAAVTGADESTLRTLVDVFRVAGVSFLRPYGHAPIKPQELIDISHEALIRCWDKIADPKDGWLVREFRNGLVWRALLVQADSFERDATNVLAPATTDEREQWLRRRNASWAERYGGGWDRILALLGASTAARDRERSEEAAAREREAKSKLQEQRFKLLLIASALQVVLLIAAVYFGLRSWDELTEARLQFASVDAARASADDAREQSDKLAAQAQRSEADLRELVKQLRGSAAVSGTSAQTSRDAAREIEALANKLYGATPASPVATIGPRVYVHITDDRYRPAASAFERALEALEVDGTKIVVPGIELVKASLTRSVLRCFTAQDCLKEGKALVAAANSLLQQPQLELQDLSARYGTSTSIRPRHYEVWFAPGAITLRGVQQR